MSQTENEGERIIKAMSEAIILGDPTLKDVLTVGACVQYLKLPDSTYGWIPPKDAPNGGMPMECKIACIIPTIINRLQPGHIIWIGNRPYARAEAFTYIAARDLEPVSGLKFRPFSDEEKSMFGIKDKDMATVVSQRVMIKGREVEFEGFGVIGDDESQPNKYGNFKVAMEKTRDRMQFVRTRAIRDMWSRHISVSGIPGEDDYTETLNVTPTASTATPAPAPQPAPEQIAAPEPDNDYQVQAKRISALMEKVVKAGGVPGTILNLSQAFQSWAAAASAAGLHDAADVLEEWLESNGTPPEPPTPPPPKTKVPVAAPVAVLETGHIVDENGVIRTPSGRKSRATIGPDGKPRTRGKPPKNPEPVTTMQTTVTNVTAEEITATQTLTTEYPEVEATQLPDGVHVKIEQEPIEEYLLNLPTAAESGEQFVFPENPPEEQAEPDYFADHADSVEDNVFAEENDTHDEAVYTGTESQKGKIRLLADAAGLKDDGNKHAIAGAMRNRPMGDLPKVIGAIMQSIPKAKPDEKKNATERLTRALQRVSDLGGAHMQITGTNTLNILDGGTVEAMNNAAAKLELWQPNGVAVELNRKADAPAVNGSLPNFPRVPVEGPAAPSYKMLHSAYGQTKNEKILARIIDLANRKLQGGDHNYLPAALRLAGKGDFKEIDALIAARELRG